MRKRYERPTESTARADHSIKQMLHYDLHKSLSSWRDIRSARARARFMACNATLKGWLKNYSPSYTFRYPTGETVTEAKGDVSLHAKLECLDQWNVSPDALVYAAKICFHNSGLKAIVKRKFKQKFSFWRILTDAWAKEAQGHIGFSVFKRMFKSLCTINGASRVATVPKDNTNDRVITCEPMWNMVVQLSIAHDLKQCLRGIDWFPYDLAHRQEVHKEMISSGKATIDFSNASNSNWWGIVRDLFPKKVVENLALARTGVCEYKGEFYGLNMMAPMGCGFTFEVMTLTLLAYARSFDPAASVFGDDVIIDTQVADDFISFSEDCGWIVNQSKSFLHGDFRESCGSYYDLHVGHYLVSYDFHWPTDMYSVCLILNKIRRIVVANQVSNNLKTQLIRLWVDLAKLVPCDAFREPSLTLDGAMVDYKTLVKPKPRTNLEKSLTKQLQRDVSLRHFAYDYRVETRSTVLGSDLGLLCGYVTNVPIRGNTMVRRRVCREGTDYKDIVLFSMVH